MARGVCSLFLRTFAFISLEHWPDSQRLQISLRRTETNTMSFSYFLHLWEYLTGNCIGIHLQPETLSSFSYVFIYIYTHYTHRFEWSPVVCRQLTSPSTSELTWRPFKKSPPVAGGRFCAPRPGFMLQVSLNALDFFKTEQKRMTTTWSINI